MQKEPKNRDEGLWRRRGRGERREEWKHENQDCVDKGGIGMANVGAKENRREKNRGIVGGDTEKQREK